MAEQPRLSSFFLSNRFRHVLMHTVQRRPILKVESYSVEDLDFKSLLLWIEYFSIGLCILLDSGSPALEHFPVVL